MKLDQVLQKIGVEIVKATADSGSLTLLMRVHNTSPMNKQRWALTASDLVRMSEKAPAWSADVSKVLVQSHGSVVFFWRVILTGNTTTGQRVFGEAALKALRSGSEVVEMPLVGQVKYEHDPARGKLKGGHPVGTAEGVAAYHFSPRPN